MYILRVETENGAKRYAYGSEAEALKKMRFWIGIPNVVRAEVQAVGEEIIALERSEQI